MTSVIILADAGRQDVLRRGLSPYLECALAADPADAERVASFIAEYGGAPYVLLLDMPYDYVGPLLAMLPNRAPTVAIVETPKDGFSLLAHGVSDMVVRKPDDDSLTNIHSYFYRALAIRVEEVLKKKEADDTRAEAEQNDAPYDKIIALGSSTGGTEALLSVVQELPADVPPVLMVQHMPPVFTRIYAERLDSKCRFRVREARDGDRLRTGLGLLAPGDYHMTLTHKGDGFRVGCEKGELVCNQRPSVDVLFKSVAQLMGRHREITRYIGVILTGMGSDGAEGLLQMRRTGAHTVGQDEGSCVVYGMPKAAFDCGAVLRQLPLNQIAEEIMRLL
jgi:two-component system chemotaxis response regulator CheB